MKSKYIEKAKGFCLKENIVEVKIGKIIKELRKDQNMSQTALAELLFTSQDTISLWELDKSLPDVEAVVKMAKIFKVSTDYILGLEK